MNTVATSERSARTAHDRRRSPAGPLHPREGRRLRGPCTGALALLLMLGAMASGTAWATTDGPSAAEMQSLDERVQLAHAHGAAVRILLREALRDVPQRGVAVFVHRADRGVRRPSRQQRGHQLQKHQQENTANHNLSGITPDLYFSLPPETMVLSDGGQQEANCCLLVWRKARSLSSLQSEELRVSFGRERAKDTRKKWAVVKLAASTPPQAMPCWQPTQ